MGFFSLKDVCGVCGNEVGLNRFKVSKSDTWICPECLKKAGGLMKVNVKEITIEGIKELVENQVQRQIQRADNLENNPLLVAEGMYNYCKQNGFGSGWNEKWGVKHFKVIEDSLLENEDVLMTFIGLHNYESATKHNNNFAYAITNKRIIMAQKDRISGEILQTVYLNNINDITFKSGALIGIMTIDTSREKFNVGLDKQSAQKINNKVLEIIDKLKNENKQLSKPVNSNISVVDEIKKFKELLDIGAITQDEFETKKKQLLGI